MNSDENLGSFTTVEPSGSGSGLFIPTAIALTGVLLGGIALYLTFAGSGKSGETQAALAAATEQTASLEARLDSIEESLNKLSEEIGTQDTRLRTLASQTQVALNKVGQELNVSREQLSQTTDKVAEISEKLANANATRTVAATTNRGTLSETSSQEDTTSPPREHTIASGETFAKLASQYNVSIDAILSANPDADPRRLQVGQKIKIPGNEHNRE